MDATGVDVPPDTAVIVIDVQQALCEGAQAVWDGAGTIARINQVTAQARRRGVPVILVQHEEADGAFRHGSAGWQLAQGLQVEPGDQRVGKTTPDAFWKTDLLARLQALGAKRLVVCGMQTEFCVDTTARAALRHGYPVTLVSDGHTTVGHAALAAPQIIAHHNATLPAIGSFGPRVALAEAAAL
ncbi:cysteine hydrolase family protein [Comamonas humi]